MSDEEEKGLSTPLDSPPALREPEKLTIPAPAVGQLLNWALQEARGNAWWQGFVTAHGIPSWIEEGQWALSTGEAHVVRIERRNGRA